MNDDDDDGGGGGFMNSLQRMFFLILMDYFIVLIAMIHFLLLVCRLNIIIKLIIIITFINRLQTHLQTEHNVITPCSYSSAFTSSQHTPRREESVSQDSIDQLLLVNNQSLNTFQLNPSANQYPITTTSNEHDNKNEHEHEHEHEHDNTEKMEGDGEIGIETKTNQHQIEGKPNDNADMNNNHSNNHHHHHHNRNHSNRDDDINSFDDNVRRSSSINDQREINRSRKILSDEYGIPALDTIPSSHELNLIVKQQDDEGGYLLDGQFENERM